METIEEKDEVTSDNPLLIQKVLKGIFKYASVRELKTYRLVCEYWKHSATPFLREKSIVKLQGVCPICKSEWNLKSTERLTESQHDHRQTISFYRFVLQVQSMFAKEREALFYKNFQISKLNLYFIPRLNTEPTKYFLLFVKLIGASVFELILDSVQLCPTEAIYRMMPFFKNLEKIKFERMNVWTDPVSHLNSSDVIPSGVPNVNSFLTIITISGDWMSEEMVTWDRIFKSCPALQELNLIEVPRKEILNCFSTLVNLPEEDYNANLHKLSIHSRAQLEDYLNLSSATNSVEMDSNDESSTKGRKSKKAHKKNKTNDEERELQLNSMNMTQLLVDTVKMFAIFHLNLRLPYTDEGSKFSEILGASSEKLSSLILSRESKVFFPQAQVVFKQNPFELIADEKFIKFPFIKSLDIAHNFIDNFDEIKQSFPSLQLLKVNVVPTEFCTRKSKSYHAYLRTTALINIKNQMTNETVTDLIWNIQEVRNSKGIRTVLYKSNALKHVPRIFLNVVRLSVSITRAQDLHIIFREMSQLINLTVLKNSFYRTKDEDIIGWGDDDSESEDDDDDGGAKRIQKIQNAGIKQLKNLERLTLENNNCCLTNKAVRHGIVFLRKLRSLYISRGKRITFYALRILRKCPYLVSIHVTKLNDQKSRDKEQDSDDEAIAAYQLAIARKNSLDFQPTPSELNSPYSWTPTSTSESEKYSKTKIPSLILPSKNKSKKMTQYTMPSANLSNIKIGSRGGQSILPILVSTTSSPSQQQQQPQKETLVLPSLTKKSSVRMAMKDPLPGLTDTELKYVLSLSESEFDEYVKETQKRKKSQENIKMQLGEQIVKVDTNIRNLTLAELKSQERIKRLKGGKYELSHKYSKIGGNQYTFVRTNYKVNGRSYQLVRRKYEHEGEQDKIWATQRAWLNKKKLQQQREAAKAKAKANANVLTMDKNYEQDLVKLKMISKENEEESEYERSIRDYDEDEDEDLEEYCDDEDFEEDDIIKIKSILPQRVTVSDVSETETSDEEGIFLDTDSNYEGDKEFYDSVSSSGQDHDDGDESDQDSDSDFKDGKRVKRIKGKKSDSQAQAKESQNSNIQKKQVTFQTDGSKISSKSKTTKIPKSQELIKEQTVEINREKEINEITHENACHRHKPINKSNDTDVTNNDCLGTQCHHDYKIKNGQKCSSAQGTMDKRTSGRLYKNVGKTRRRYRSADEPIVEDRIFITVEPIRENSLEDLQDDQFFDSITKCQYFCEDERDPYKYMMMNYPYTTDMSNIPVQYHQYQSDLDVCKSSKKSTTKKQRELSRQLDEDEFDATLSELRCQMINEMHENLRNELVDA